MVHQNKDRKQIKSVQNMIFQVKSHKDSSFRKKFFDFKNDKENSIFKLLFFVFLGVLLILLPLMSLKSGTTGDENVNYKHAELVYNYYAKGDTACLNTNFNQDGTPVQSRTYLEYYGQSFDNFTYLFNKVFHIDNYYQSRHILNSLCGWLIFLIVGLLAVKMLGWRGGLMTIVLLFLYPRFTGHVFNNPKDIPFALGYVWSIYQIYLLITELPVIKLKRLIYLILAIAFANSVRIGGLMLIPYLFLFVGLWFLIENPIRQFFTASYWKEALKLIGILSGVSVVAYFIGLLYWPYALQNPIKNPMASLQLMTDFSTGIKQIFDGKNIWSSNAPASYLPTYIWISTPLLCLAGLISFIAFTRKEIKALKFLPWFMMIFVFVFPIAYIIYQKSNVYGGLRHILFTLPFLVLMAGTGYEFLWRILKNKIAQWITFILILILAFFPLKHIIKNHPFTYVYFNEISGGISQNYGSYETDYYYHGNKTAVEKFMNYVMTHPLQKLSGEKTLIYTDRQGDLLYYFNLNQYDTAKYVLGWSRFYERFDKDWDYYITFYAYTDAYQLKNGIWPPVGCVATVDVDGKPMAALIQRQDKSTYQATLLETQLKQPNLTSEEQMTIINQQKQLYHKALSVDKNDETALLRLSQIYRMQQQQDSAMMVLKKLVQIHPSGEGLQLEYIDFCYNMLQQTGNETYYQEMKKTARRILDYNPKSIQAYDLLFQLYKNQNNQSASKKIMLEAIDAVPDYIQGYYNLAQMYIESNQRVKAKSILQRCVDVNQRKYPEEVEQVKNDIKKL